MKTACAFLILLLASPASAQLKIGGETKVKAHRLVRLTAEGLAPGATLIWDVFPEEIADTEETGGRLLFVAPPGTYTVKLRAIAFKDGKASVESARVVVTVGEGLPPGPDPKPVQDGFRVLFIYETQAALSREQRLILNSTKIREYLNRKTEKDGGRPGWRSWDKDIDVSKESQVWRDIWAAVKPSAGQTLPLLIILSGKKGEVFALPATEAATLALLESKGGK